MEEELKQILELKNIIAKRDLQISELRLRCRALQTILEESSVKEALNAVSSALSKIAYEMRPL